MMIDNFDDAVDRTDTFVMDLFGNRVKTHNQSCFLTPNVVDQVSVFTTTMTEFMSSSMKVAMGRSIRQIPPTPGMVLVNLKQLFVEASRKRLRAFPRPSRENDICHDQ
ncbi:MAG: hypothetical protein U0905_15855 [Pirellulales bacterium]